MDKLKILLLVLGAISDVRGYGTRRAPRAHFANPLGGETAQVTQEALRQSAESPLQLSSEYLPPGGANTRRTSLGLDTASLPATTGATSRVSFKSSNRRTSPGRVAVKATTTTLPEEYLPPTREALKELPNLSRDYLLPNRGITRTSLNQAGDSVTSSRTQQVLPVDQRVSLATNNVNLSPVPVRRIQGLRLGTLASGTKTASSLGRLTNVRLQNERYGTSAGVSSQTLRSGLGNTLNGQVYVQQSAPVATSFSQFRSGAGGSRFRQQTLNPVRTLGLEGQRVRDLSLPQLEEVGIPLEQIEVPARPGADLILTRQQPLTQGIIEYQRDVVPLDSSTISRVDIGDQIISGQLSGDSDPIVGFEYVPIPQYVTLVPDSARGEGVQVVGDAVITEASDGQTVSAFNNPNSFIFDTQFGSGIQQGLDFGFASSQEQVLGDNFGAGCDCALDQTIDNPFVGSVDVTEAW